jgi:hypothetical protein
MTPRIPISWPVEKCDLVYYRRESETTDIGAEADGEAEAGASDNGKCDCGPPDHQDCSVPRTRGERCSGDDRERGKEALQVDRELIRRSDGALPYNSYLWPSESWWLYDEFKHASSRWMFSICALANGKFAVEGYVWAIRDGHSHGRKNNYPTRKEAIRAAAARLIRGMRGSRTSGGLSDSLNGSQLAQAINWVLDTVAGETCAKRKRVVTMAAPIKRRRVIVAKKSLI